jgi:hypothetical protein
MYSSVLNILSLPLAIFLNFHMYMYDIYYCAALYIQEEVELVSMVTSGSGRVECDRPASDDDDVFVDALR